MIKPAIPELACWSFQLTDENPGPSTGDAGEYIERLGFNPWSLQKLDLVYEFTQGWTVTGIFIVIAQRDVVERLRLAHEKAKTVREWCPEADA